MGARLEPNGCILRCPWHGLEFSIGADAEPVSSHPVYKKLTSYRVTLKDGRLELFAGSFT